MHARSPTASRTSLTVVCFVAAALLVGCGPTRTAGTGGLSAKDLAVLSIPQLPAETHVQIKAVQFDDAGEAYDIGKHRDFYLRPRDDHTATFTFTAKIPGLPGPLGWFVPGAKGGDITIPGPKAVPLGAFVAGKTYELAAPTIDSFDTLLEGGQLSLVREKVK